MRKFGWVLIVFGVGGICMGIFGFETDKPTDDVTIVTRGWLRAAIEKKPEMEVIRHSERVDANASDRSIQAIYGVGFLIGGLTILGKYPKKTATTGRRYD